MLIKLYPTGCSKLFAKITIKCILYAIWLVKLKIFLDAFNPDRLDARSLLESWFDTKVYCDTESPNTKGKFSDETLYRVLFNKWNDAENKIIEHARGWIDIGRSSFADRRYDRGYQKLDLNKLKNNEYIDSHLPRPPENYTDEIQLLFDN